MIELNDTHDTQLRSWVDSANNKDSDFPIQNLPFAVFRRKKSGKNNEKYRVGVAIGDQILDMPAAHKSGVFDIKLTKVMRTFYKSRLNHLMALDKQAWSEVRSAISTVLRDGAAVRVELQSCLIAQADAEYKIPARIGDYTDFYTSINHATNIGKLFRPDNPLLPNYQWVPIAYHGRSSSIKVSGHDFHRPIGQIKAPESDTPILTPSKRLDYELEVGIFVGTGNALGHAIALDDAEDHVFGLCLFNDWSARDIQAWEYQPLGPFLSKSFASTVSPWVITLEALAPYRQAWHRPKQDPQPLPYLESAQHRASGAIDLHLEVLLQTTKMKAGGDAAERLASSNFAQSYWSVAQMVTHHSVNGCNLKPGDFFGSGTQSGTSEDSVGSLIEATAGGKTPITLSNGEQRTFLEDGDTVTLRGWCTNDNLPRIGFGEATATVLASLV